MTFLWIALDGLDDDSRRATELEIAHRLSGVRGEFGMKINDDFIRDVGWETALSLVREHCPGRRIFADLKMFKGKRTMCSDVRKAAQYGASLVNAYALADTELPPVVECAQQYGITLAALTVLSHYDDDYCWKHFGRPMGEAVMHFALVAQRVAISYVILPGKYLSAVDGFGFGLKKIVTGIRPKGFRDNRHRSEVAPEEVAGRADMAVVGSPVMKAADPETALREMLVSLGQ
jgi:orotidine-5'-phosphate decarboxylase